MEKGIKVIDKQDSIEISRNAKGEYSFKVKEYFDADTEEAKLSTNEDIERIINDLKKRFL